MLGAYGIPLVESRRAATAAEAGRAAAELGGPVVMKAIAEGLVHKSDAGGVVVGVRGETAAVRAARRIAAAVRAAGHEPQGFLVQRMAPRAPSCSSASSATRTSGRSSPAAPAAARSSCSATPACGSRRSAAATPPNSCARCARSRS